MWSMLLLFMVGGEIEGAQPIDQYGTLSSCIEAARVIEYNQVIFTTSSSVILDNNKVDGYAVVCMTQEIKV